MIMPPRLRKVVLTAHVATSVGWLGAVVAYLVLDVTAVISSDIARVRGMYAAMEVIVLYAVVPLALGSVLIALVNALGTPWGLVRHYWVLAKLLLTLLAAAVLLIETRTVSYLAATAAAAGDPRELPGTLPHSIGGLAILLLILTLSVFKPRGVTRYGWHKQNQQRRNPAAVVRYSTASCIQTRETPYCSPPPAGSAAQRAFAKRSRRSARSLSGTRIVNGTTSAVP